MNDVTKCNGMTDTGELCPKREKCVRYTSQPTQLPGWQAWFVNSPYFNKDCEMYLEKTDEK